MQAAATIHGLKGKIYECIALSPPVKDNSVDQQQNDRWSHPHGHYWKQITEFHGFAVARDLGHKQHQRKHHHLVEKHREQAVQLHARPDTNSEYIVHVSDVAADARQHRTHDIPKRLTDRMIAEAV